MTEIKILDQKVLDNRKVILQTIKVTGDNIIPYTENRIILPYLTDDELMARYKRIKPIVSIYDLYYYLKKYNVYMIRNKSYLFDAKKDIRGQVKNIRGQIDMNNAETIAEFHCYHPFEYYAFFEPSIADVLQQFPDDVLDDANAFYMTSYPKTSDELKKSLEIVGARCHQSTVKALKFKN